MGTSVSMTGRDQALRSDQRQSARRVVSEPIPLELQPGRETWIRDMGEGGLSVSGNSPLELGTSASIAFELPESDSVIDAAGVVAWSDESGRAGIRFTRVEPDSAAALRKWLDSGASTHALQSEAPLQDADLAAKIACLREVADLQAIISSERLETAAALDLVVSRMAELTRSTGAAIALREGQDVFCRATFGNAPDVGVKLSTSSLSGECLRSGAIVMLEDSENDSRVSPEVCRQLNFRSLLVLPVNSGTETIGIAEVLSPEPRNFEGGDVLVVSFLTDLIASIAAPKENATPEYERFSALPVLEPLPTEASQPMSEAVVPSRGLPPVHAAPALTRAVSRTVSRTQVAPAYEKGLHGEKDIFVRIPARGLRISVIGALLALVLLLLGYYYRHSRATAKPGTAPQSAPSTTNSVAPPSQPTSSTTSVATPSSPVKDSKAVRTSRPAPAPVTSASKPAITELAVIQGRTVNLTSAPEATAPEPLAISALGSANGPSSLPASIVAARPVTPDLPPSQSQGVVPGKLIKRVLPQYPDMARRAGVSGDVVMTAVIQTNGMLRQLKVVSGSPLLREAALDAARQWRYSPYMLGGKPVEAETHITVSFHQ